jgi:hypothetical protein
MDIKGLFVGFWSSTDLISAEADDRKERKILSAFKNRGRLGIPLLT